MILLLPFIFIQIPFAATKNNYHGNPPKTFIFRGYLCYHPYIQGVEKKTLHFSMGFGGSSRPLHHLVHHPRITPCPSSSLVMPCVNPSGPWVKDVRVASWAPSIRFGPSGAEEAGWGTTSLPKTWSSETTWLLLVERVVWFESGPLFIGVFPWFSAWFYECSISGISARHCTIIWIAWISC